MSGEIKCPFCPLEKKTKWYLETEDGIVVCRDLHNRGFKYRLLVVGSGKYWHRPRQRYSTKEIKWMVELGIGVANEHIKEGRVRKIASIDIEHLSYPDHWHLQVNLL